MTAAFTDLARHQLRKALKTLDVTLMVNMMNIDKTIQSNTVDKPSCCVVVLSSILHGPA